MAYVPDEILRPSYSGPVVNPLDSLIQGYMPGRPRIDAASGADAASAELSPLVKAQLRSMRNGTSLAEELMRDNIARSTSLASGNNIGSPPTMDTSAILTAAAEAGRDAYTRDRGTTTAAAPSGGINFMQENDAAVSPWNRLAMTPTARARRAAPRAAPTTVAPTPTEFNDESFDSALSLPTSSGTVTADNTLPTRKAESLTELYERLVNGVKPMDASLSDQQQNRMLMNFGLSMLAKGAAPGARLGSAIGEGGQEAMKYGDAQEAINRAMETHRYDSQMARAGVMATLADKQQDNVMKARQLDIIASHYSNLDASTAQHMKILAEQVAQGKYHVNVVPGTGIARTDAKTGETTWVTDSKGNRVIPPIAGDHPSSEERIIATMRKEDPTMTTADAVDRLRGHGGGMSFADARAIAAKDAEDVRNPLSPRFGQPAKTPQDVLNEYAQYAKPGLVRPGAGGGGAAAIPKVVTKDSELWKSSINDPRWGNTSMAERERILTERLKKAGSTVN